MNVCARLETPEGREQFRQAVHRREDRSHAHWQAVHDEPRPDGIHGILVPQPGVHPARVTNTLRYHLLLRALSSFRFYYRVLRLFVYLVLSFYSSSSSSSSFSSFLRPILFPFLCLSFSVSVLHSVSVPLPVFLVVWPIPNSLPVNWTFITPTRDTHRISISVVSSRIAPTCYCHSPRPAFTL